MKLKIEKYIPIPETRWHSSQWSDLEGMEVGESVFLKAGLYDTKKAGQACANWMRGNGWKASLRTVEDGVRIWRTE